MFYPEMSNYRKPELKQNKKKRTEKRTLDFPPQVLSSLVIMFKHLMSEMCVD